MPAEARQKLGKNDRYSVLARFWGGTNLTWSTTHDRALGFSHRHAGWKLADDDDNALVTWHPDENKHDRLRIRTLLTEAQEWVVLLTLGLRLEWDQLLHAATYDPRSYGPSGHGCGSTATGPFHI